MKIDDWIKKLSPLGYDKETIRRYYRRDRGDKNSLESIYKNKVAKNTKNNNSTKEKECKKRAKLLKEELENLLCEHNYGYGIFVSLFVLDDSFDRNNSETMLDDLLTRDHGVWRIHGKNLKLVLEDFMDCSFLNMLILEKFFNPDTNQFEIDYAFREDVFEIVDWILKYSHSKKVDAYNKALLGVDYRKKSTLKSELNTIKKFKEIAIKRLCIPSANLEASSLLKGKKEPTAKNKEVSDFISMITEMEKDLEKETSTIIPEQAYQELKKVTKKELKKLLNNLSKKYDRHGYSQDISNFVANLVPVKDMRDAKLSKMELTSFYSLYNFNPKDFNITDFSTNP